MPDDTWIVGRVLFVGAHCDDIEIGCGGTAAKCAGRGQPIVFATATLPSNKDAASTRRSEATQAAAILSLSEQAGNLVFGPFFDGELEQKQPELRGWLKSLLANVKPDTVFVHRADEHTDHRAVCEVAKGVFADKTLVFYYIPRPAPDEPFKANVVVETSEVIGTKVKMCECHASQRGIYVAPDSVRTNAHNCYIRWLGARRMAADGYAEEFEMRALRPPVRPENSTAESNSEVMRDELRLVRNPDGTFAWVD